MKVKFPMTHQLLKVYLDRKIGDEVTVQTPGGEMKVKIIGGSPAYQALSHGPPSAATPWPSHRWS